MPAGFDRRLLGEPVPLRNGSAHCFDEGFWPIWPEDDGKKYMIVPGLCGWSYHIIGGPVWPAVFEEFGVEAPFSKNTKQTATAGFSNLLKIARKRFGKRI